ncbi:alpha-2-macroglobulin-like protein 1 [Vespa velutina]|uniref:alpha-2-macroglobulin-like protein 1 n=1 Tax=Vespa velutina TaxID=202808 RepID=UPI001FB2B3C1|nr:alpha-2-macroglobulin-like protein 1 [Vespa velutina]
MLKSHLSVLLIYLLTSIYLCQSSNSVKRGYVFTAPKRFLAGETESGCLSLHNLEPPAHILLELLSPEREILASASTTIKSGVETCLELMVPSTKYSNARLQLKMKFDKHPDYSVDSEKEVYIEHDSIITFLETDKPVYKPGQDVNIRILMLKHDLKPWKKRISKIWIENPSEIRVAQWTNMTTVNGMLQLKFSLTSEASPGTWKIEVEKKKSQPQFFHTTVFEVKKYVLPKFQVKIISSGYILADAENVTWNICAKYSYGKPVKGTLFLKLTPQTPSWKRKLNLPEIHYETELDSPDGCTEFALSSAVLGLANWKVAPNNIALIANFTEAGTGIVETTISRTVVVHQALKLEFIPYMPKYFKLGLPYHGKLRVLRQDDVPAANEKIQLCLRVREKDERSRSAVECRHFISSGDGFIDFVVPPPHKHITLLTFIATGVDYPTKYYSPDKRWRIFMDQPSAYIDIFPWYSPSDSYLAVARGYQPIVCGEKYSFNVMYTVPVTNDNNESISFHYSINSKGDLLIYGHVKHRPTRETVLNYSDFRNLLAVESPTNKTDQNTIVHRFPLSVKITPSMAPVSELLLYYVRPDGETVATSYTIEVGHCFENKVKTAWHIDAQSPGTTTQYHVEAAPWSLCGISAVDKSTVFLAGSKSNLLDPTQTFNQLKRFHLDSEWSAWAWTNCKIQSEQDRKEVDHLPFPAIEIPFWNLKRYRRRSIDTVMSDDVTYVDAAQAFNDFGTIVMSDLIIETKPCPKSFFNLRQPDTIYTVHSKSAEDSELMFKSDMKTMPMAYPLLNFPVPTADMAAELAYVDQSLDLVTTLRSYFPETWLWELMPIGKEGKLTIERTLPHTITDWVGHTVCISPVQGLGIAPPTTITTFQPFFLDYSLPYSVKRGEMLRMKVSLFNYMQHSLPVRIQLEDATGLDLHLSNPVSSFCVKPTDSVVHEYILRPRVLGNINITVSAAIDANYPESCGPDTLVYTRDTIVKPILVLPEGFPVEITKSAFICPKDFSDDSRIVWNLDLPKDLIPGSAKAHVTLTGDVLGPVLENLDKLVKLPMGCGEQNMVLFVPNIHVIGYLDVNGMDNPELRAKAIKHMEKGYQRELNYRHTDGSYSAFGPGISESSIWLTAFIVKSFAQARSFIYIDERDLKISVKWIMSKQLENGCFPIIGNVFHKHMKGGLQEDDSSAALTAYILISLLESGVLLTASLINNALYCLEALTDIYDSPYTAALSTYALALLEHPKANGSMASLMNRATRNNDLLWWEDKTKPSVGLSIEMTGYAVLSLIKLGGEENMVDALKAIRWMSKQRNAEGGFTSTQDTVVGLEALTKYALAMATNSTDLSVLVTASEVDHVYRMNDDNRVVLIQIQLPILPTIIEIFAEGEGCVLVQNNLIYNVAKVTGSEAFDLSVSATSDIFVDECSMQRITVCARYKMADEESNMALLEIGMISGYVPDRSSLHSLLEVPSTKVKRIEDDRDIVTIYFDRLIGQKTCIFFNVTRENIVDRLEPANVKLYDYYQQELMISSNYNFAPTCSSADINEETEIPDPMPVETEGISGSFQYSKHTSVEHDKTLDKSSKNFGKDSGNMNNKVTNHNISMELKNLLLVKPIDSSEKEHDTVTYKKHNEKNKTDDGKIVKAKSNIPDETLMENSDKKITTNKANSMAKDPNANNNSTDIPITSQGDTGSGQTPDDSEINSTPVVDEIFDNPSFVSVDHDLETPEGIEGPVLVYVRPSITNLNENSSFDEIDYKISSKIDIIESTTPIQRDHKMDIQLNSSDSTYLNRSCPICSNELPDNFNDIYCSASSVIKVAIRRLRKARLLLDLNAMRDVKRLRSTVELVLNPRCTCPPLDNPGSLGLLLRSKGDDFATLKEHGKQILNNSMSIYGLSSTSGVPQRLIDARLHCSKKDKKDHDRPVGG